MYKFGYVPFVTDKSLQFAYGSRITVTCCISWSKI